MGAAGAAVLIALAAPRDVLGASPAAIVRAVEAVDWRFDAVHTSLPPVDAVYDRPLEVEDWREYAYDGGALRVYVSRDGGRIIALLGDTSRPPYEQLKELELSARYDVVTVSQYAIVVPIRPIDEKLFEQVKAKSWTPAHLAERLGPPSYQHHVHGAGWMFLEWVPQALSFVEDPAAPGSFYLCDWTVDVDEFGQPSRATHLAYADYREHVHAGAAALARKIADDRETIAKGLSAGARSPDGRLVAAAVDLGVNTPDIAIGERGRAERRHPAHYFVSNVTWLDEGTVLYRVDDPVGEVDFYTLDAAAGRSHRVVHLPEDSVQHVDPAPVRVLGHRRFSYRTMDGREHEVTVPPRKDERFSPDGFSHPSR